MEPPERPGLLRRLGSRRALGPRQGEEDGAQEPRSGAPQGSEGSDEPGDSTRVGPEGEATTATSGGPGPREAGGAPASTRPAAPDGGEASRAPRARSDPRSSPTASTIADPAPLGLAALALTTLVLSLFNAELLPAAGEPVVLGLAFAYGGLAQLLAGMWAFRTPNTFAATAFVSYGAFWISFALLETFFADDVPAADLGAYLGWTLIAWGLFTTGLYVVSVKATGRVNVVFGLLGATLYLLGIGEAAGAEIVTRVGGYVGIVTALAAGYASFATMADATFGQKVLPVREIE